MQGSKNVMSILTNAHENLRKERRSSRRRGFKEVEPETFGSWQTNKMTHDKEERDLCPTRIPPVLHALGGGDRLNAYRDPILDLGTVTRDEEVNGPTKQPSEKLGKRNCYVTEIDTLWT